MRPLSPPFNQTSSEEKTRRKTIGFETNHAYQFTYQTSSEEKITRKTIGFETNHPYQFTFKQRYNKLTITCDASE
jgi:hypothetical protein